MHHQNKLNSLNLDKIYIRKLRLKRKLPNVFLLKNFRTLNQFFYSGYIFLPFFFNVIKITHREKVFLFSYLHTL